MNKVILTGRATRGPEYNEFGATHVAKFHLAVDGYGKEKKTDFIYITTFGKLADFAHNYIVKGTKLLIVGRLTVDSYETKDGQKRTVFGVTAENIEFCESKAAAGEYKPTPSPDLENGADDFMDIPDAAELADSIPFK